MKKKEQNKNFESDFCPNPNDPFKEKTYMGH